MKKSYIKIAAAVAAIVLGLILIFIALRERPYDEILLKDIDPILAEELAGVLVYTAENGQTQYYSPSLDIVLTIDQNVFAPGEGETYLALRPSNVGVASDLFIRLTVHQKDANQVLKGNQDFITAIYKETKVEEIEQLAGDIQQIRYQYTKAGILNEGDLPYSQISMARDLGEKTLLMEISGSNAGQISQYLSTLQEVVASGNEDIQGLEQLLTYEFATATVKVDRSKWFFASQSSSLLSLNFRSEKYEDAANKASFTSFRTSLVPSIERNEAWYHSIIANKISYYQGSNEFVNVSKDAIKLEQGGLTYYGYELSYQKDSQATKFTMTELFAYDPANAQEINVYYVTSATNSIGYQEAAKIFSTLLVSEPRAERPSALFAYSDSNNGAVLGTSSVEIEKAAILGKPAVMRIFNRSCAKIKLKSGYGSLTGKTYNLCTAGYGTGFFVNNEGYVVTNAHVAASNSFDVAVNGGLRSSKYNLFYRDIGNLIYNALLKENPEFAKYPEEAATIVEQTYVRVMMTGLLDGSIEISNVEYDNYLLLSEDLDISEADYELLNKKDHLEARLIDHNEIVSNTKMLLEIEDADSYAAVADLALLKIDRDDVQSIPTLSLADPESVSSGSKIHVIGFPGAANSEYLFGSEADNISTITLGNISAVKPNSTDEFDLVQIDASTSPGNSGGPIINSEGEVVAVLTYGLNASESADYNVGVSVEEVIKLLDENQVVSGLSEVSNEIDTGLDNLGKEYYSRALSNFNTAESLNTEVSTVLDPLQKIAEEKISAGEDKTPLYENGWIVITEDRLLPLGAGAILLVLAGLLVIINLLKAIFGRKAVGTPAIQAIPSQPTMPQI